MAKPSRARTQPASLKIHIQPIEGEITPQDGSLLPVEIRNQSPLKVDITEGKISFPSAVPKFIENNIGKKFHIEFNQWRYLSGRIDPYPDGDHIITATDPAGWIAVDYPPTASGTWFNLSNIKLIIGPGFAVTNKNPDKKKR